MFNYKPTYDKIIVKEIVEEVQKSNGGIFMPVNVNAKTYKTGKVIATGPGYIDQGHNVAPQSKTGDTVIFSGSAAYPLKIDNEMYLIMPDKEILAIVNEEVING